MHQDVKLREIKSRLENVIKWNKYPWKYSNKHPMFVGTTNAIEIVHPHPYKDENGNPEYPMLFDLGRDNKEWYEYRDAGKTEMRLTDSCKKNMEKLKALGEFIENCREDIKFMLDLLESGGWLDRG